MKTEITEMFGVKYPIICGAMLWVSVPALCAAVSNAGGLGNLTAGNYETEEDFGAAIRQTRSLTDKPFVVNISIHPSVRISADHYRMYVKVCAQEHVAGMEVSGAPLDLSLGRESIDTLKKAGVKLFQKVSAVRQALHAEKAGYDGVYAAGWEEGGRLSDDDVTSMVLTPSIVDAVRLPVVTCGGIADGRTMAAALNLGAQGVMMGTRFLVTRECRVHENFKKELVHRQGHETTLINKTLCLQSRVLRNEHAGRILEMESRSSGLEDLMSMISGLHQRQAWASGQVDHALVPCGQTIGLIRDLPTCRELLDDMSRGCEETLRRSASLIA